MSERKVANKYYPPDFDPAKIPRRKRPRDQQIEVRLMAPFSMRCNTCGNYIYKGKKFNARKETVLGETYYGIRIFRFYIKCPQCSAEITFKTDPKNTDYAAEHGASRNFEPWRDASKDEQDPDADPLAHLIAEEEGEKQEEDPMKALEARTLDAKREMEILDALQDIRTRNARLERVDADAVLEGLEKGKGRLDPEEEARRLAEEEDEALVRRFFGRDMAAASSQGGADVQPAAAGPSASLVAGSSSGSAASEGESPLTPRDDPAAAAADAVDAKVAASPRPTVVKRVAAVAGLDADDAGEEREPDVTSLLSETMRAQLAATQTAGVRLGSSGAVGVNGRLNTTAKTSAAASAPLAKKKKAGASPFGVVRKA